jgi:hypothetical protein
VCIPLVGVCVPLFELHVLVLYVLPALACLPPYSPFSVYPSLDIVGLLVRCRMSFLSYDVVRVLPLCFELLNFTPNLVYLPPLRCIAPHPPCDHHCILLLTVFFQNDVALAPYRCRCSKSWSWHLDSEGSRDNIDSPLGLLFGVNKLLAEANISSKRISYLPIVCNATPTLRSAMVAKLRSNLCLMSCKTDLRTLQVTTTDTEGDGLEGRTRCW